MIHRMHVNVLNQNKNDAIDIVNARLFKLKMIHIAKINIIMLKMNLKGDQLNVWIMDSYPSVHEYQLLRI